MDDYVKRSPGISYYGIRAVSYSAWIYLSTVPTNYYTIYFNGNTQSGNDLHLGITNYLQLYVRGDNPAECDLNYRTSNPNVIPLNQWVFVVGVMDADGHFKNFFVNSNLINTYSYNCSIPTANDWDTVGIAAATGWGPYWPFNGFIDEFRIYNRALSAEEIKALYEATK